MSIDPYQNPSYKSNPFIDIVLFAGADYNYENQYKTSLQGEAAKKALQSLGQSYQEHKNNLKFKYGDYLHNVEIYLSEFNNPSLPSEVRLAVAKKVSELANQRIVKESNFSSIHRFFHKIGQLFKGHGFRTKGERGLELASKIEKIETEIFKAELRRILYEGIGDFEGQSRKVHLARIKDKINGLTDVEFREVLGDIIFMRAETNTFGKKNKLIFYENLSEEKQKIFDQELFARPNWFSHAFDIVNGFDKKEEMITFVSKSMVDKIKSNPADVLEVYKQIKMNNQNSRLKKFFEAAMEATIASYLREVPNPYGLIAYILDNIQEDTKMSILGSPSILTSDEIVKLKSNIRTD